MGYSVDGYTILKEDAKVLVSELAQEHDFDLSEFLEEKATCWTDTSISYGSHEKLDQLRDVNKHLCIHRGYEVMEVTVTEQETLILHGTAPIVDDAYTNILVVTN